MCLRASAMIPSSPCATWVEGAARSLLPIADPTGARRPSWPGRATADSGQILSAGLGRNINIDKPSEAIRRLRRAGWRRLLKGGVQIMNVLKRASARPATTFGLPILLSGAILLASEGLVSAADKMVGGEFATKGIVTSTVGPNDAKGQPASALSFPDDEGKNLPAARYSGGR